MARMKVEEVKDEDGKKRASRVAHRKNACAHKKADSIAERGKRNHQWNVVSINFIFRFGCAANKLQAKELRE